MESTDVDFARRLMLAAHEQANIVLRDQQAQRARQQVQYLQQKLAQITVSDYRLSLLQILSAQETTLMLTQTDASFAAEILDPPVAPTTPVSPRPVLSLFVAMLVGTLVGAMIVIFLGPDWWRRPLRFIATRISSRHTVPR
jgi:capsular polysaccharide biosynthesis protein